MAYTNFKPTIWSKKIQHELAKFTVLEEDCNRAFQGEARMGETVKILGAGAPTVKAYVPGTNIAAAETPAGTTQDLKIDQYNYTHFVMDDVDRAQSIPGVMEAVMEESTRALAAKRDSYIANLFTGATNISASLEIADAAAAKAAIDAGFVELWDNGVLVGSDVSIVLTPWFYNLFKDKLTELSTNNVELLRKGVVGMYNGAAVKISNNLKNDLTDDYMAIRTNKAVAFAGGIEKVEAYRPEGQFSDAIKVLDTFGAKIIRQNELYVVKAHQPA